MLAHVGLSGRDYSEHLAVNVDTVTRRGSDCIGAVSLALEVVRLAGDHLTPFLSLGLLKLVMCANLVHSSSAEDGLAMPGDARKSRCVCR